MKSYQKIEKERQELIGIRDSLERAFNGEKGNLTNRENDLINDMNLQSENNIFDTLSYRLYPFSGKKAKLRYAFKHIIGMSIIPIILLFLHPNEIFGEIFMGFLFSAHLFILYIFLKHILFQNDNITYKDIRKSLSPSQKENLINKINQDIDKLENVVLSHDYVKYNQLLDESALIEQHQEKLNIQRRNVKDKLVYFNNMAGV